MNPKDIKGAIFDCDGVLFDSMWMWRIVEVEYLESLGVTSREDLSKALRTLAPQEVAEYFRTEYGLTKTLEEIIDGKNALMSDFYNREVLLKPGVSRVLDLFRKHGIKMCAATATDRYLVEAAMQKTGILGYFGRIFTCSEEKTSKSRPDIFIRAAGFLGTEIKETLVVEDALHSIRSAKNAGFPVAGVFDQTADIHQDEIRMLCDHYFLTVDEMAEMFSTI